MGLFSQLKQHYVASSFRRNDLKIIEAIEASTFGRILDDYTEQGWELTDAYGAFDENTPRWDCKLRKGASTLSCKWRREEEGSISGLTRIVTGLAERYNLTVHDTPSQR